MIAQDRIGHVFGQCAHITYLGEHVAGQFTLNPDVELQRLVQEADRSMNGPKVVAALTQAITERGARPRSMTLYNGSEFAGRAMEAWAMQVGVQFCFIRPGRLAEIIEGQPDGSGTELN